MTAEELCHYFYEELTIKNLERSSDITIYEKWWSKRRVFGIIISIVLVGTVVLAYYSMTKWPQWTYIFSFFPLVGFYFYVRPKNFGKIYVIDRVRHGYKMDYQDYRNLRLKEYLESLGYSLNKIGSHVLLKELSNLCHEQYKHYRPRPAFVFYAAVLGGIFAIVQPFVAKVVGQSKDLSSAASFIGFFILPIIVSFAYVGYKWVSDNPFDLNRAKSDRYYTLHYKLKCLAHEQQLNKL